MGGKQRSKQRVHSSTLCLYDSSCLACLAPNSRNKRVYQWTLFGTEEDRLQCSQAKFLLTAVSNCHVEITQNNMTLDGCEVRLPCIPMMGSFLNFFVSVM